MAHRDPTAYPVTFDCRIVSMKIPSSSRLLGFLAALNLLAVGLVEWLGRLPGGYAAGAWGEMAVCMAASLAYGWLMVSAVRRRAGETVLLCALGLIAANWVGLELLAWLI